MRSSAICVMLLAILSTACHRKLNKTFVPVTWNEIAPPEAPDYSNPDYWAALPTKKDSADLVPRDDLKNNQENAVADVFFIHPTTFLAKDSSWNATILDEALIKKTDGGTIKHQASVFNGSCRVFAPRYRQGHLKSYFNLEAGGESAIRFAYTDVRKAFQYYLDHYNDGRPILIASHSQGTTHAIFLLQEFFDGTNLQKQLVSAYLVGFPVQRDSFQSLCPCENPEDINCYNAWCTYGKGFEPHNYDSYYRGAVVTNPVSWTLDSTYNSLEEHRMILYKDFTLRFPNTITGKPGNGVLWIKKPQLWFRVFLKNKSWHVADYNLFWLNIRENVATRLDHYLEYEPLSPDKK